MLLQELRILEMLPFDQRIVQLYGSCTKDGNILLVLELMQVTFCWCKYPVPTHLLLLLLCIATAVIEPAHIPMLHALFCTTCRFSFQAAILAVIVPALTAQDICIA